jgi:hypothetical protein
VPDGSALQPVLQTIHEVMAAPSRRAGVEAPFDPSTSPLHGRPIFIVGAPRSGTTWLHQMLSTHPDVATAGEAHVFCEGVSALLRNHEDPRPKMMLSTWVTRGELVAMIRRLLDDVFETMRVHARPEATRILDKSPNHIPYAADLAEVYPDAAFVHIIRDARDSVSSQRDLWGAWDRASREWETAGRRWVASVEDNRRHLSHLRYHEVVYEDLVRDPVARLAGVFDAVGLEHHPDFVTQVVEFCRAPINVRPSDARVGVRKWDDMDPIGERDIVRVAGDLMVGLGYLDDGERQTILRRRSLRDAPVFVRDRSGRAVRGARSRAGAAVADLRRRGPSPGDRRALAERLAAALVAGDVDAAAVLLGDRCALEEGDRGVTGRGAVAARLVELDRGGRVVESRADERAASVHVITPDGGHLLHRVFGDGDRASRIVVQGAHA